MSGTTNNNQGGSQQAIPQVTTFQFSNDAVGQVKDSVNLFTGTANLPVNIASLPGRKDLDVNIGIMYNSHVKNNVQNWNLTNPTGILGLGWDMSFDKIVVNKNGSGTATSDQYYLLSNGSGTQLIQDGFKPASPVNILLFQMGSYEFWSIAYDASSEKWTVIKEDGTLYIYGDKNSGRKTLQFGVGWGNWLGDAATQGGQEQYVTSWNLSEVQNKWGEKITYSYDNDSVKTGSSTGLEYTQACYLKTITDSFNRTISFNYEEKFGAKNPGIKGITEYQAANTQQAEPNAYQEQYETRYLDYIEVHNAKGLLQFSILFEYDFINIGVNSQTGVYPLMYKRVLTSFWQVQPNGKSLPGMEFSYYDKAADINSGALKSVLYPQGATATYVYKEQPLNTNSNINLSSPLQGATPRIWFGSDYTVATWYNAGTKKLKAIIYSWCGNWIPFELNSDQPTTHYFDNVDFDIDTLGVITRQDYIAIYFTEKTKKEQQLFLYRRNPENFGVFNLSSLGPQYLALKSDTAKVGIEAGSDFVIAFSKDFTTTPVVAYQWNWKQKSWNISPSSNPGSGYIPVLMPTPADVAKADNLVITARDNYYIAALYTQSTKLMQLQLFYHDGNNVWNKSALYSTSNVNIYKDPNNPGEFPFNLSLSNAFAVATYITDISATEVKYSQRILQWDKAFNLLNSGTPLVNNYTSAITNNKSQFSIFNTILTNSLITNNAYLNRYIGGPANSNNPLSWKQATFTTQSADVLTFATGNDIAILSKKQNNAAVNQFYQFNANTGSWGVVQSLPSSGENPTISGNYLTAGKDIFYKDTKGNWVKQQQQLNNLQATQTVQNRGASYIAYQDTTAATAQTYFMSPLNGIPGNPLALPVINGKTGQKIVVEQDQVKPGTLLAGADMFVTYPSDEDFNAPTAITLYKVVDGKAIGAATVTPVAYIEIANEYDMANNYYQSYDYASSAQSVITYNAQNNLAQFPKVTVVTGSKIPNSGSAPAGISISYFSNAVSAQSEIAYPSNWVYNYNQLLNGTLLQKLQYNKAGELVTRETNYWQIFQSNIVQKNYLFGAFFRIYQSVTLKDGVSQTTSLTYFQDIGLQQSGTTSYRDSAGNTKIVVTEKKYAIQTDAYKQAMAEKHFLNALTHEATYVTDAGGSNKKYIASNAVTWKNWADDNSWKWGAYQNYQWLGPADGTPDFDFTPNAQRTGWLKKQEIISRGLPYEVITEMSNVDGLSSSYIYDTEGHYQIAEFLTASRQKDEASYYDFEPYETADGWQLGSNAVIIPNANNTTVDARMGTSSLKISTGTGITRQFTPQNQERQFVFSGYVKVPDAFDVAKGVANWVISFTQNNAPVGTDVLLPFDAVKGSWHYVFTVIDLKDIGQSGNGLITITIKAQNNNTDSSVLIDCLRFSPLQSLFSAVAVNQKAGVVDATLGGNGEVRRKFFDDFQRISATTGFSDESTSIATSYFSRTGNDNKFSTFTPNSKFNLLAAGGGPALSFTQGDQWKQYWAADSGATWQTVDGTLQLESFTNQALLTYSAAMANEYGILVNVNPLEALTQSLGLKVGNQFTLQWDVATAQWQLLDAQGTVLQQKAVQEFVVETSNIDSTTLLAETMRPKLLRRGLNISKEPSDIKATKNGLYDAHYNQFFALNQSNGVTTIAGMGNQWLLLVTQNSLLFFVDGQLVFNYVSSAVINGTASLFTGNKIALGSLITSFNNQLTFTAVNEAGNDKQSQVLDNTRLTVIENIYDNQGRIIANTKPAFVNTQQTPLFEFYAGFATFNASNGVMTGFIADFYPDDEGYPYFGSRYETSPLGRVLEQSMPGIDYKLGTHTERIAYGPNDGAYGLPANEYFQTTVTDQNDNTVISIFDTRGLEVRKVSQKSSTETIIAAVYYDEGGNPVEMRSPNYKDSDPDKESWITYNAYNFIGQLISNRSANTGTVNMVYDASDRLRFRCDAEAQAQGNYQYYKYDGSGRITETGYINGVWNRDALQQEANTNPAYPPTPATWRLQTFYDYNGTSQPYQVGQIIKTLCNHADNGTADVEETFVYDIFGNVKTRSQKVTQFDAAAYTTAFTYNNLGGIVQIDYPVPATANAYSVYYKYNSIGQITGIGNQPDKTDNLAAYSYNPAGKPVEELLNQYGGNPVTRNYGYNPQVWLKEINDSATATNTIFNETLKTKTTAGNGQAYYNGQSAEIGFTYPQGINAGATFINQYNGLNALTEVDESGNFIDALNRQYTFDDNGNFDTIAIGGESYQFIGEDSKADRLQSVKDTASNKTLFNFEYDQNGAIDKYVVSDNVDFPEQDLRFRYDAGNKMTTLVEDAHNTKTFNLYYSSANDRVLKQERANNAVIASTLYVKSLSGSTLVQIREQNNQQQVSCIIYGPIGIIAFVKDDVQYTTLKDHLGSVRVILDDAAAVVAAYDYDLYGNLTILKEPEQNFFSYLYTSQEYDTELGIYNYKARFYFSTVGRFGVTDAYNQFYSPYIYAGNSPIVYIDPSGNFSIGNFFSAIGGAIIGAFEILIGIAVDIIAGILDVLTLGLATPISVGLSMVAGAFIGSGVSAVSYSAVSLISNDFSWKDYGINTAVGFVAGAITAGFGAVGAVAAEAATGVKAAAEAGQAVSTLAKVANSGIKAGFTIAGGEVAATASTFITNSANGQSLTTGLGSSLVSSILSSTLSYALPGIDYKSGWGNLFKRMAANVAKSEAIGVTLQLGSNAVNNKSWDTGLLNTVVKGVVKGSIGGLGSRDYAKATTKSQLNFMGLDPAQNQAPADGIIRL